MGIVTINASGDGTTDDTDALLDAIKALGPNGGTVFLPVPPVSYLLSSTILLGNGVTIIGEPSKSAISTAAGMYPLFSIGGSDSGVENLVIQNQAKTGGPDILIDPGSGTINRTRINNLLTWNSYGLVADTGTDNGCYVSTWVTRCQARQVRYNGFSFTRSFAYLFLDDCVADFIGSTNPNYTGFALDNSALASVPAVGGALIRGCSVTGTSTGSGAYPAQGGFCIYNTNEVWALDCDADTVDRFGWNFTNVNHLHMANCEAGLCGDFGMVFTNVGFIDAASLRVYGRSQITHNGPANGINFCGGCSNVSLTGVTVMDCTGDGIFVPQQAGRVNISGGQILGCAGYGLQTSGSSSVLASGLSLSGNTANYSLGGPQHYLQVSQLNNGAVVSVGPGPVAG